MGDPVILFRGRHAHVFNDKPRDLFSTEYMLRVQNLNTNKCFTRSDIQRDLIIQPQSAAFVAPFQEPDVQSIYFRVIADFHDIYAQKKNVYTVTTTISSGSSLITGATCFIA